MDCGQKQRRTSITYNHMNLPIQVSFVTGEKITYLYDTSGKKLQKTVWKGSDYTPTDYLSGFQYIHETLDLFPTAEGYVKYIRPLRGRPEQFNYVFNHEDHLGNIRMSYAMDKEKGKIYIMEENHYYPFGLKHEKYNSDKYEYVEISKEDGGYLIGIEPLGPQQRRSYQYKYQGQERQDELGLNWDSFKWRNYDYALGRFMSIDPLAEKYPYNSTYAFQENKMGMSRELEGLELVAHHWMKDASENENGLGPHMLGIVNGINNAIMGVVNAVTQPKETLEGLGNLMIPSPFPGGSLGVDATFGTNSTSAKINAVNSLVNSADNLVNGNGFETGTVIGEITGSFVAAKGLNYTSKALGGLIEGNKTTNVFRVFGGDAKAKGFSWTPDNPNSVPDFREAAGLPSGGASGATNTGQFVIEGTVKNNQKM